MSGMLSRDAILAKQDITIEKCEVPEWGGHIFVKTMSGRAKERWEQEQLNSRGTDEQMNLGCVRASLVAGTACDETGSLLFSQADVDALNEKSILALDRAFELARKLNRIGKQDVEDLTKNSDGTPAESSPSA